MRKSLLVSVALCAGLASAAPAWAAAADAGHGTGAVGRRPLAAGLRRRGRGGAPERASPPRWPARSSRWRSRPATASRPARCWPASTPAPPSRTPAPATRRCGRARRCWTWPARTSSARSSCSTSTTSARPRWSGPSRSSRPRRPRPRRSWRRPARRARRSGLHVVRAPFAGVVAEVPVALGDMAMPGQPLLTLYDPGALRVTAARAAEPWLGASQAGAAASSSRACRRRSAGSCRRRHRCSCCRRSTPATHTRAAARSTCPPALAGAGARACSRASGCRRPRPAAPSRLYVPRAGGACAAPS